MECPQEIVSELKKFYPWWSEQDHNILLSIAIALKPKSVLEFGSGRSTLTLIEANVPWIDTFEDNEEWFDRNHIFFAEYTAIHHHFYVRRDPLFLSQSQIPFYDMGFVDGPRYTEEREPEAAYARDHCKAVVFHDWEYGPLNAFAHRLYNGWRCQEFVSDPGIIALLTRD